ncbi:MAG: VOC family protein [Clostridia bacterium]|nr:VOC family protein [Clostridia bacterium]
MRIGEVCLNTNDVLTLADFYKRLFGIDNESNDETHQTLISEETQLTIYNDGTRKNNNNQNICLAFTVKDIQAEYEKIRLMGVEVIEKPTRRPWGTINMCFYDPDRNVIYFRSIL